MGRSVVLSNGKLAVGLNELGLVHDFYYPYVGLDNVTTARSIHHKIGVWVDGNFSWTDQNDWTITADFESGALITKISMTNERLQLQLDYVDFVDSEFDVFCRQINVVNTSEHHREVRLFMHQVFQISNDGRADTALYLPNQHAILNYKGRRAFLAYGEDSNQVPFDQFAVGNYGIEGKEGTYKDAEDGELAGGTVEHGGVDSVIRFKLDIAAGQDQRVDYWIVAAQSEHEAIATHTKIKSAGLSERFTSTRNYWQHWLSKSTEARKLLPDADAALVSKSLLVIKAHTDARGGIVASTDSSMYNYGRDYYAYVWPRDAAYALWPLIRLGYTEEAKRFFLFCKDVISPEGYLYHKYQSDRAIGSTWHSRVINGQTELPIQEDETAGVIYMIAEYMRYSGDTSFVKEQLYSAVVKPAADFMARYIDTETGLPHASFDLWEQKYLTNTYTVAVTYQALLAAVDIAEATDHHSDTLIWRAAADLLLANESALFDTDKQQYRKGYLLNPDGSRSNDDTLDISSLYGVMIYSYFTTADNLFATAQAIEQKLLDIGPSGGAPRFEGDGYFFDAEAQYQGNPWIVTTLWMAQYYLRTRQIDKADYYLTWARNQASQSGIFAEQVHPVSSAPISVAPLVWSHAEYINTALDVAANKQKSE